MVSGAGPIAGIRRPGIWRKLQDNDEACEVLSVELVKLGKKGQVTIPRAILRSVGLTGDAPLLVETTAEGAILLKPAAVYPVEIYSASRVEEFERENAIPDALQARVLAALHTGDIGVCLGRGSPQHRAQMPAARANTERLKRTA